MIRTPLLAASAALGVLVSVACGGQGASLPEGEVLDASRESFAAVESVLVRMEIATEYEGVAYTMHTEFGVESSEVMFTRYVVDSALLDPEELNESLFIRDDLYVRSAGGDWYIMSPWSQGTRPEDVPELGAEDLRSFYEEDVTPLIKDLVRARDDRIDDETFLRFEGIYDPESGPDGEATLWLHKDSYLPRRVELNLVDGNTKFKMELEFVDYNLPVQLPEPPADARPWRDHDLPDAPCTGDTLTACLAAQGELEAIASDFCEGEGRRVCLVPLGQVDADLIRDLVQYYHDQYGLTLTVLPPAEVPDDLANPLRGQVGASELMQHMNLRYPYAMMEPEVVLIGITPVDVYMESSHFRYVFGVKQSPANPQALISTFRMDPETYGEPADYELLFERTRKMLTKYIGLLYYGMEGSSDPTSPLYSSILGPDDLDRMAEPLTVPQDTIEEAPASIADADSDSAAAGLLLQPRDLPGYWFEREEEGEVSSFCGEVIGPPPDESAYTGLVSEDANLGQEIYLLSDSMDADQFLAGQLAAAESCSEWTHISRDGSAVVWHRLAPAVSLDIGDGAFLTTFSVDWAGGTAFQDILTARTEGAVTILTRTTLSRSSDSTAVCELAHVAVQKMERLLR